MNAERLTKTGLLAAAGAFLLYDAVIVGYDDTASISEVGHKICKKNPVIPFVAGFCLGHLLWGLDRRRCE